MFTQNIIWADRVFIVTADIALAQICKLPIATQRVISRKHPVRRFIAPMRIHFRALSILRWLAVLIFVIRSIVYVFECRPYHLRVSPRAEHHMHPDQTEANAFPTVSPPMRNTIANKGRYHCPCRNKSPHISIVDLDPGSLELDGQCFLVEQLRAMTFRKLLYFRNVLRASGRGRHVSTCWKRTKMKLFIFKTGNKIGVHIIDSDIIRSE